MINSDTVTAVVLNQNANTTVPVGQSADSYTGPTNGILVSNASGSGLANYAITYAPATLTIQPKALSVAGQTAANKVYDSGTIATINSGSASLVGVVGSDAVSLNASGTYGTFASANAANGIAVTVGGNALTGSAAGNYTVVQPTGLTANITPASLTVTAIADAKFVTLSDTAGYNGAAITGFVGSETSTVLGGTLAITRTNASVNSASLTPYAGVLQPSGLTSSNYNIQFVAGDYQIVPAQTLIVKVANATVTYGGTATLVPTSVEYLDGANLLKSLTQTAASGNTYTYSDGVGGSTSFTLTATGSTSTSSNLQAGASYSTTGINFSKVSDNFIGTPIYTGSLAVTKRALTATTTSVSKVYDGSTSMAGLTIDLSNLVANDVVGATGVGAFSQSNAGSSLGYSISNLSLNGADKNNYYLSGGTSLSGNNGAITARPITLSANGATKVYGEADPTYSVSITSGSLASAAAPDTLAQVSGTLSRSTGENVGNYNIALGSGANAGTKAANYNVTYVVDTMSITPAALSVTGVNTSVTYTGLAHTNGAATVTGLKNGESFSISGYGTGTHYSASAYADTMVASPVAGTLAGNYSISYTNGGISIGKAGLVVTAGNKTRIYGDANPALTYTVTGYVSGEGASVLSGSPALTTSANTTSNIGNEAITAAANSLSSNNYSFTFVNGVMAINPRPIIISAEANQSKLIGNIDPALTYSVEANGAGRGIVGSDIFSGNLIRTAGEEVAIGYAISQGTLANINYLISFVPSNFEIKPLPSEKFGVGVMMSSIAANNNFQTSPPAAASIESPKASQVSVTQTYASNSQALTVITAQIPATQINNFSFKVPDQIAKNIASSGASVTAQMADGKELPSWLKFDPKTMEFKAQADARSAMSSDVIRVSLKFGGETIVVEIKTVEILDKL